MIRATIARSFLIFLLAVASFAWAGPTAAQDGAQSSYVLRGFRSAHFGMTQAQVHAAIVKDFHVRADQIETSIVPDGRTPILAVRVDSLFPQSGAAEIAYFFGYRSERLIQVSITFSLDIDPRLDANRLVIDGKILEQYFRSVGYPPKQVAVDRGTAAGLVFFQGTDPQGHLTVLLLQGPMTKSSDGKSVLNPRILRLNYVADPQHPDVMKSLAKSLSGQF